MLVLSSFGNLSHPQHCELLLLNYVIIIQFLFFSSSVCHSDCYLARMCVAKFSSGLTNRNWLPFSVLSFDFIMLQILFRFRWISIHIHIQAIYIHNFGPNAFHMWNCERNFSRYIEHWTNNHSPNKFSTAKIQWYSPYWFESCIKVIKLYHKIAQSQKGNSTPTHRIWRARCWSERRTSKTHKYSYLMNYYMIDLFHELSETEMLAYWLWMPVWLRFCRFHHQFTEITSHIRATTNAKVKRIKNIY